MPLLETAKPAKEFPAMAAYSEWIPQRGKTGARWSRLCD